MEITIPVVIMGILSFSVGAFLAYFSKKLEVKKDPKVENINDILPGVNCGACGYPGCSGYAAALVNEDEDINLCAPGGKEVKQKIEDILSGEIGDEIEEVKEALPGLDCGACGYPGCSEYAKALVEDDEDMNLCNPGGEEVTKKVGEILGEEAGETIIKKARVMCNGGNDKAKQKYETSFEYKTCASDNIHFGGRKSCSYGCLGYGDCVKVCPADAIKINNKGIAKIDESKCISCGKCVTECPKDIIDLVPEDKKVSVYCKSYDIAKVSKEKCEVSCIGCGICERNCPFDAIYVKDGLAKIDYSKCTNCGICELKCPTNAIVSDIKEKKVAIIDEETCVGCTICKKICPVDAIEGEIKQKHKIDPEKCVGCEECVEKCPTNAIEMKSEIIKK
ncbi:MAG: RnfABCDGE type electron transport complex subunit B [Fusobacteriota bacterium]